jgi:hypothetical protein
MELVYIRKTTFIINGNIMHYVITIPLNKNLIKQKTLKDENCETFD